jgi:hypothetical protein
MRGLFLLLLLWAPPLPAAPPPLVSLDQVKAEPNAEHRARLAVDYAAIAEKNAEAAYAKGDLEATAAELKNVQQSFEAAEDAFTASHKTPGRNPGPYKYAEMRSRELLIRLNDLEHRMDSGEREMIAGVKSKVQEIHDAWFEGIMGRTK